MKKLSDKKAKEILNCIQLLDAGDYIKFNGVKLVVYNSSDCLIYVMSIND